jgi:hypothetical protein
LSGRSLADFSQYYIFPWAIDGCWSGDLKNIPLETFRDLQKPMGQLGPKRLRRFDEVFANSQYFYGTHYMHLGVVLFYLVRVDPFSMFSLYMYDGWDHPNRMFFDIAETWLSAAYFSLTDVREMVPQLMFVPEVFTNVGKLPLKQTTDGRSIADVRIGNWCHSAREFTTKMKAILESDRVSHNLHNWIDLIFGFKTRGDAAIECKNVFDKLCYADQTESGFLDPVEQEARIKRIVTFGQCPQMLFRSPHIGRVGQSKAHLMTDPQKIVKQRLNEKQFVWPIANLAIVGRTVLAVGNRSLLIPPTFTSCLTFREENGIFAVQPITNFRKISKVLDWHVNWPQFKINADGSLLGIQEKDGWFSLFWIEYDRARPEMRLKFWRKFFVSEKVVDFSISLPHFLCVFVTNSLMISYDIGLDETVWMADVCEDIQRLPLTIV